MKSLSYRALNITVEIIFIFYLLGAALGMGMLIYSTIQESRTINVSFSHLDAYDLSDEYEFDKISLESNNQDIEDPSLKSLGYKLHFKANGLIIKGVFLCLGIVSILYMGVVLWYLRKIVLSLEKDSPFTNENYKRLRLIGFMILLVDPLKWLITFLIKTWINANFQLPFGSKSIANYLGYHLGYTAGNSDYMYNSIFFGLLILVIAEVFRQGLKMREEQELTI